MAEQASVQAGAVRAATEKVELGGIPETMLWTLHNRASEAKRSDARLKDPDAIRIYDAIDYDYEKSFGKPDGSHPMRSLVFDEALRPWLTAHPGGTVVELACGLETQFQRCDDGKVQWLCVDVSEALDVRERFLPESPRCRHVRKSALDLTWMSVEPYGILRAPRWFYWIFSRVPVLRNVPPTIVHVRTRASRRCSSRPSRVASGPRRS